MFERLFAHNRQWAEQKISGDARYFQNLASYHDPEFLYIGCSDSRVPITELIGVQPGDLFVHRNIANLVPNTDLNSQAVIEYAVGHLHVKAIIVCGHYACGGVKAAMESDDLGMLNPWLGNIRDIYRLHMDELDSIQDKAARYDRLVELNVREQCINVLKTAVVQKSFVAHRIPTVHGWIADIRTGLIKDLDIDMQSIVNNLGKVFRVTRPAAG